MCFRSQFSLETVFNERKKTSNFVYILTSSSCVCASRSLSADSPVACECYQLSGWLKIDVFKTKTKIDAWCSIRSICILQYTCLDLLIFTSASCRRPLSNRLAHRPRPDDLQSPIIVVLRFLFVVSTDRRSPPIYVLTAEREAERFEFQILILSANFQNCNWDSLCYIGI